MGHVLSSALYALFLLFFSCINLDARSVFVSHRSSMMWRVFIICSINCHCPQHIEHVPHYCMCIAPCSRAGELFGHTLTPLYSIHTCPRCSGEHLLSVSWLHLTIYGVNQSLFVSLLHESVAVLELTIEI